MIKTVIKENRNIILINIILIFLACMWLFVTPFSSIKDYYVTRNSGDYTFNCYIYGDSYVLQEFVCNCDNVDTLELQFTSTKTDYHGYFHVYLMDELGNIIQEWQTSKSELYNNEWLTYNLNVSLIKGNTYNILIKAPELSKANAVEVIGTNLDNLGNSEGYIEYNSLYYNEQVDGCIALALADKHVNIIGLLALILLYFVINIILRRGLNHVVRKPFGYIFLLGMVMLLILAPSSGPDEDYHYSSSLMLSNALLGNSNITEAEEEYIFDYEVHYNSNNNFKRLEDDIFSNREIDDTSRAIAMGDRINKLNYPITHIIPATAMAIGRMLQLNSIQVYTFARLSNLLCYALLCSFAIGILPVNKELLFVFAINPMALQQATQLSYDMIINALGMIFFALFMKTLVEKKDVNWREIVAFGVLLLLFGPIKYVYFAHVLLLFIVPNAQFGGRIKKCVKLASMVGVNAIVYIAINRLNMLAIQISNNRTVSALGFIKQASTAESVPVINNTVETTTSFYTVTDVLHNPIKFFRIFVNSFNRDGWSKVEEAFGSNLSISVSVFKYLIILYIIGMAFMLYEKGTEESYLPNKVRAGLIAVSIVEIALITAAGFLMTSYGSEYIEGIQGRYYIPPILLLIFGMRSEVIQSKINKQVVVSIIAFVYIGIIIGTLSSIPVIY